MKARRDLLLSAALFLAAAALSAAEPSPLAAPLAAQAAAQAAAPLDAALPAGIPSNVLAAAAGPSAPDAAGQGTAARLEFSEIWAYLMSGEERFLDPSQPVTDLGYFGAGIGVAGKLVGVPARSKLPSFKGRVHLVVAELSNSALMHFSLSPEYPLRDTLVADIVERAGEYDGVQIDFESMHPRDYENFYAFLALLKEGLGVKSLSVALPAHLKDPREGLGYERVAKIVDRIVVMAYDEHWSTSEPGPVASIDWCRKVSAYAVSKIGSDKLVMGLPFYGRAWADKSLSRAYKYSSLAQLIDEKGIWNIQRKDEIPYLEYEETVSVKVYFDDYASTLLRLGMYRDASVRNVAFWRLGQEDAAVWGSLAVSTAPMPQAPAATSAPPPATPPAASPDYSKTPYRP
jgi:hypothetical protein